MNWQETIENCSKEYAEHLYELKKSLDQLNADKAFNLGQQTEEAVPDYARDKNEREQKAWQKEWGIYGTRLKDLVQKHQKQVYAELRKKDIVNDLTDATEKTKDKGKQNGRGR